MKYIFLGLLLVTTVAFGQKNVNAYKYIIVPNKFEFVKQPDKFRTSSLTKFLFNKYGFTAYLDRENYPEDLAQNKCTALVANVVDHSGFFTIKIAIELRDCYNTVIHTSAIGKSKIKDFKRAYHEAIRNAFESIKKLNYRYTPVESVGSTVKNNKVSKPALIVEEKSPETPLKVEASKRILYAQSKENGYQLVNTKPEVVYEILNTNVKDVFIIKNTNGILYNNNGIWFVEYYKNNTKIIEKYEIKF